MHTFTGNEVIATEVPQYLNQNFSGINTEVTTLSANAVKTINGKKATNNNINISEFDSYWKASETVTVGDVRFLGGRENSGIVLECVKTGTTGSTQPTVSDYVGMGGSGGEIESVLSAIEVAQTQVSSVSSSISGMVDYITVSYINGKTWYRKWKSGWVEQGGWSVGSANSAYSVTLSVPFIDANYTLVLTSQSTHYSADYNAAVVDGTKSKTSFKFYRDDYESGVSWYACGQGA